MVKPQLLQRSRDNRLRQESVQATVVNRTFPIATGATRDGMTRNGMLLAIKRRPALHIGRAEQCDAGTIHSTGDMGRPRIVADEQIEFAHHGGKSP